jgi:hypothetical protein
MSVYLCTSPATTIFNNWDSAHRHFIVNLIGCAKKSDVFKDPSKFSQQSVFTSFSFRINHGETAECYGDTGKALELKGRGFMWW